MNVDLCPNTLPVTFVLLPENECQKASIIAKMSPARILYVLNFVLNISARILVFCHSFSGSYHSQDLSRNVIFIFDALFPPTFSGHLKFP